MTGATCGRELRRWLVGLVGGWRGGGPLDPGCSWGLAGSSRAVRGRSEGQEAVGVGLCILRGTEMVHNHAWRERN